jgi:hypothetical protein
MKALFIATIRPKPRVTIGIEALRGEKPTDADDLVFGSVEGFTALF